MEKFSTLTVKAWPPVKYIMPQEAKLTQCEIPTVLLRFFWLQETTEHHPWVWSLASTVVPLTAYHKVCNLHWLTLNIREINLNWISNDSLFPTHTRNLLYQCKCHTKSYLFTSNFKSSSLSNDISKCTVLHPGCWSAQIIVHKWEGGGNQVSPPSI